MCLRKALGEEERQTQYYSIKFVVVVVIGGYDDDGIHQWCLLMETHC